MKKGSESDEVKEEKKKKEILKKESLVRDEMKEEPSERV